MPYVARFGCCRVEDNRMLFTLQDNLKGVSEQDVAKKAGKYQSNVG